MSLYTQTPEEAHQSLYTQTPEEAHQIFEISYTHNTPLFILFYLPNCPYCKQVLPIWKQTTNHKNSKHRGFVHVDCAQNKQWWKQFFTIQTFPHFVILKNKTWNVVNPERTVNGFLNVI